ncbi:MAG: glutamate--tRNA ligase [Acidimicrobiaceae bacterium]|nr:glutamate--tRNA ligase [Acidimicrobiaceae bacterium]
MHEVPRVRFAPSPTGYFHVGGARTALFNWLFAKRFGGVFVLRIEDTDEARNSPEWIDGICSALEWLKITWDEGPFLQSERLDLYEKAAQTLFHSGKAYYCDCQRSEIDERVRSAGLPPGYDGFCRDRGLQGAPGRALRFKVPKEGETVVSDLVRGRVAFENRTIDDFILVKGNGAPLFVLANVVDDLDMRISHVIRAEEHLPTTPKAILVYQALDQKVPQFAHVPVLVNEKRQKLSKRRDRVAVEDYKEMGFLPEAMENYLVLLGWSPGDDREFLTRQDELDLFSLDRVGHSPSFFDVTKMLHFNKHYISLLSPEDLLQAALPYLEATDFWDGSSDQRSSFLKLAPEISTRIGLVSEIPGMVDFVFQGQLKIDESAFNSVAIDLNSKKLLERSIEIFSGLEFFGRSELEAACRAWAEESGPSLRKLQAPIRVAITGKKVGPPLFSAMEILGRETSLSRLADLAGRLHQED